MAKYRMVRTNFWTNPTVSEEMTPEDKYFYLYLLTNPSTTQIGIYQITKKQMAYDLGYSIETVQSLMERFIHLYKVIRYNPETRELAIKNWGKYNLEKGGKPVMDCMYSELKVVKDTSLIQYVAESIQKEEICRLFESFCEKEESVFDEKVEDKDDQDTYLDIEREEFDDTLMSVDTIRGQKEKEKENKKEKQQQKAFKTNEVKKTERENSNITNPKEEDAKEIIEFWDDNGFGYSKMNPKQQLISWLDYSSFPEPKQVILKAMNIACVNNKRRLNYVVGILRNWKNESLLTVEEINSYHENQKTVFKNRQSSEPKSYGRDIPRGFVLDLTAGEDC